MNQNKSILIGLTILSWMTAVYAIPAIQTPIPLTQPDGTIFKANLMGDEWQHWYETEQGYTIARQPNGQWVYVQGLSADQEFVLSSVPAHVEIPISVKSNISKHIRPVRIQNAPDHRQTAIELSNVYRTNFDIPLLLIDYPNMTSTFAASQFDSLMNQIGYTTTHGQTGSFRDYYLENSYGQFDPRATIFGWFRADSNYQVYGSNAPNGYDHVRQMIANAVDDAEAQGVDWSQFDNDGNGYVDALNVVHAGPGAEEGNGSYVWSHKWSLGPYARQYDGVWIDSYTINPEIQGNSQPTIVNIGVICHEFGHALGLPDLYDTDYSSSGIGIWGLMASGSWGGNGSSPWYPSHFSAWSKVDLGWVTPIEITEPTLTEVLPIVEFNPVVYKMNGTSHSNEYFLFENRQQVGSDQTLRYHGLLIWHVDEWQWGNTEDFHYKVDVEQADGNYGLNYGTSDGDPGDPWPGVYDHTEFSYSTTPNSRFYDGTDSQVSVVDISEQDSLVYATFRNIPTLDYSTLEFQEIAGDGDNVPNPGDSLNLVITLVNPSNADISNVSALVSTTASYISVGTDSVQFGLLSANSSITNSMDPVGIAVAENAPLETYSISLDIHGILTSTNTDFDQNLDITFQLSIDQTGFPYITSEMISGAPAVIDIQNDGDLEILASDYSNSLYALNIDGSLQTGQWPFTPEGEIWGSPAVADVDMDGDLEIVVGSKDRFLYILGPEGNLELSYSTSQYLIGSPALGNLDNDDELEIVIGGVASDGMVFAINPDGSSVPGFPVQLNERMYGGVALGDVNNNNRDDIAVTGKDGNIYLILDDGSIANEFPFATDSDIRSPASILQITYSALPDPIPLILATSRNGNCYVLKPDGSIQATVETDHEIQTGISFLDMEGDEQPAYISFGNINGELYLVYPMSGTSLPGFPVELGSAIVSTPVFADVNGDNIMDIITATVDGKVHIISMDGTPVVTGGIPTPYTITGELTVIDTDQDNDLEILVGTDQGLVNLDIKTQGTIPAGMWATDRGNFTRTGFMESQVTLATGSETSLPNKFTLHPAEPNPFNPSTTIHFDLPKAQNVNLIVYNILGQPVTELLNRPLDAGYHQIRWNGNTRNGKTAASGVYFIRLTGDASRQSRTIKVLYLK